MEQDVGHYTAAQFAHIDLENCYSYTEGTLFVQHICEYISLFLATRIPGLSG